MVPDGETRSRLSAGDTSGVHLGGVDYERTPATDEEWAIAWHPRELPSQTGKTSYYSRPQGGFDVVEHRPDGEPGRVFYPTLEEAALEAAEDRHPGTDVVPVGIWERDLTPREREVVAKTTAEKDDW